MLKQEKLDTILEIVNTKGTITVKEIMNRLDISDMTARRYLQELADKDLLVRVHGGAEKLRTGSLLNNERSNVEKQGLQTAEKQEIARFAGHLVQERDLILIGGNYRSITGAFVGTLTLQDIASLQFSKAFVSCNGIKDHAIATFSEDEGEAQKLALENANKKYLLADHSKFDKFDFFTFYNISDIDTIITDSKLSDQTLQSLSKQTKIIKSRP